MKLNIVAPLALGALVAMTAVLPVWANDVAEEALLTVGGDVAVTLADLQALPTQTIQLKTVWDMGGEWKGVRLTDILDAYSLGEAQSVTIRAVDLYEVELERQVLDAEQPVLAYSLDGTALTDETMGPLLLLWPSEEKGALDGTKELTNWVWSVTSIDAAAQDAAAAQ